MGTLNFDSGYRTYTVNDGSAISFNPADGKFIESIYNMLHDIEEYMNISPDTETALQENTSKAFEYVHSRDAFIRSKIDSVFGSGVSASIFPRMDVTALADGLPVWLNFILAVLDVIDAEVTEQVGKSSPRIDSYIAKYRKYQRR